MKNMVAIAVATVLLGGCATLSEPDVTRISLAVREAATLAPQEALSQRPDWRGAFEIVQKELSLLSVKTNVTVLDLLGVLDRLPINEMKSDTARLSIAAARLTIALAGWSDVEIVRVEQVQTVIVALHDGVSTGMLLTKPLEMAPLVLKKTAPKHYTVK